jgi:hypothetical protein
MTEAGDGGDRCAGRERVRRTVKVLMMVLLSVCGLAAVWAAPADSSRSGDVEATEALLTASYAYRESLTANVQQTRAEVEGFVGRVGAECPGVLAGAPPERSPSTPFARGVGEAMREDEQLSELESELGEATWLTLTQANRQAAVAYIDSTRSLRWSDVAIEQVVAAESDHLEEELSLPVPAVCADMRAWVASGYKALSTATRELNTRREAAGERLDMQLRSSSIG